MWSSWISSFPSVMVPALILLFMHLSASVCKVVTYRSISFSGWKCAFVIKVGSLDLTLELYLVKSSKLTFHGLRNEIRSSQGHSQVNQFIAWITVPIRIRTSSADVFRLWALGPCCVRLEKMFLDVCMYVSVYFCINS